MLTNLHRDVLVLAGRLRGEHVRDFGVRCALPADGAVDGASPRAHAILLKDDGDALVAEAVAARQHRPLTNQRRKKKKMAEVHEKKTNKRWKQRRSTSCPSGRAQMGHGSGFSPPVDLSWD